MSPDSPWIPFIGQMVLVIISGMFAWFVARKKAKIDIELRKLNDTYPKTVSACDAIWNEAQKLSRLMSGAMEESGNISLFAAVKQESVDQYCWNRFHDLVISVGRLRDLALNGSLYLSDKVLKETDDIFRDSMIHARGLIDGRALTDDEITKLAEVQDRVIALKNHLRSEINS